MTFEDLKKRWTTTRSTLPQAEVSKLLALLTSDNEEQIRSTCEILISLSVCGLCEVLHEVDGQLLIREDVVCHRLLWEQCILEVIRVESSEWHDLYVRDYFRSLEIHSFGKMDKKYEALFFPSAIYPFWLKNLNFYISSISMIQLLVSQRPKTYKASQI